MADDDDGDALTMPAESLDSLRARIDALERRFGVMEEAEAQEPWHNGRPSATDFLSKVRGSPGFVVDEAVARDTPCVGYALQGPGTEPDLVFSKGIVGALDTEQRALYCPSVEVRELTPGLKRRLTAFHESVGVCKQRIAKIPRGDELGPWLGCMENQLRERGEKL